MSNTLRLYRELCRIDPSRKVHDITFERERKEIMKDLGYDIGEIAEAVSPLRYHGKMARRRHITTKSLTAESKKKKMLYDTLVAADKTNKLMKEVRNCINNNKLISTKICNELEDHLIHTNKQYDSSKSYDKINQLVYSHDNPKSINNQTKDWRLRQSIDIKSTPCAVVLKPIVSIDKHNQNKSITSSHNRWSNEEILLLNKIFNDIPMPKYEDKEHDALYYTSFTQRYQAHYPTRDTNDIIKKVKGLIKRKQLKLPGEIEYWKTMQMKNKQQLDNTINYRTKKSTNDSNS